MKAITNTKIRKLKGGWKVAEEGDDSEYVQELKVELCIQGNKKDGYHLVMMPEGCFAADYHYFSKQEAKDDAAEIFGVPVDGWSND